MGSRSEHLNQIGIVGLGLIGGSLGLDLQRLGYQVYGLVNRRSTLERARERGLAQSIDTNPSILSNCSIIILALPLSQIINPPEELVKALPENAVITDVGSVKAPVLQTWEKLHAKFVASHPMAGTHQAGVEAGQHGLFRGHPWVATPSKNTEPEALETVRKLALELGSQWMTADADKHDKAVALISHVPILVSAALLGTAIEEEKEEENTDITLAQRLASNGFRDTSRVGGGNPILGVDMVASNTKAIVDVLETYQETLEKIKQMIYSKEWEKLYQELNSSQEMRKEFIKE